MLVNKRKKIVFAVAVIFGLLPTLKTFAQFGMSIRAGGNLSSTAGSAFHSNKKIGFQIGGDLTYHFDKNIALQAEPAYNLMRIRNNHQTAQRAHGIGAGTRKLAYMSVPLYLKLNFTPYNCDLGWS